MRLIPLLLALPFASLPLVAADAPKPNIVIIFTDDQGYADLGCYGSETISTPHLDRLAAEGARLTDFHVPQAICTPSRAALLTGRHAKRFGLAKGVLFPHHDRGLPSDEITIAEILQPLGYATAAVGKWHLGHLPEFLPVAQGFDSYFGIPYSNDMDPVGKQRTGPAQLDEAWSKPAESTKWWNVPLLRDAEEIGRPVDQRTITRRYTDEAVAFIERHHEQPFFLYLAHSMPHVPLFVRDENYDPDPHQAYRLTIEEIDASTGRIRATLDRLGLTENTLVVFASDNGPWLPKKHHGGSAGELRNGKMSPYEGGTRVPGIFFWPKQIPAGREPSFPASTLDLMPTIAAATGAELPDRPLDGLNLLPALAGGEAPDRDQAPLAFFDTGSAAPEAIRDGDWKLVFEKDGPALFHLDRDLAETNNVAAEHPEIVERLRDHLLAIDAAVTADQPLP